MQTQANEGIRHVRDSFDLEATDFDDLLEALAGWLLLGCAGWVVAIGVAALVEAASRGRVPATTWVGCPAAVRRLLLGGLGVALAVSPRTGRSPSARPRSPPASTSGLGLPVPARTGQPGRADPPRQQIEVRAGDCLWDLARPGAAGRGSTGPGRRRWSSATYRRNRDVVGDDPDLIRPGQRLVLPRSVPPPPPEETP